ncbi:MAG: GSCFA domain-containing protein, partial [Bacteroidales bacterium]|nr:GSCFA domain-containing protein [Bacteroidales bacterium]
FPTKVNPYGVLYNPLSVSAAFEAIIENHMVTGDDMVERDGLWHSFMHHGSFSHPDLSTAVTKINQATESAHLFLQHAEFVVVTFGTAYVFEHKLEQRIVANCHKFPEIDFNRYLLETDEIIDVWKDLIVRLRVFNPGLKIIFTVSPVRHWKDGAHGNQVSKSVLILAIDKLVHLFDKVTYFPAYEIVMDELRDYRFYDAAMMHPNEVAIDYIWQRFSQCRFNPDALNYLKEVSKIVRARQHRPSGHPTATYDRFIRQTLDHIVELSRRYPAACLDDDKKWFETLLKPLMD